MRLLLTGDLHLTERSDDAYRWELFEWLHSQSFDTLIILGDLTEEKDCHSGTFVNRVVEELMCFAQDDHEVHILMGNHDYSDPNCPFFSFLRHYPNCYYHSKPTVWEIGNGRFAFYPHTREPLKYLDELVRCRELEVDFVLMHQVFSGAISESGRSMVGLDPNTLSRMGKVFSGDIHVPQIVGPVEYLGAPYPIRFGDDYTPRVIRIEGVSRKWEYLYPPHIQKLVYRITDPEQIEFDDGWRPGDQVKVVLELRRSDFGLWEKYRKRVQRICKNNELLLCGLELRERKRERAQLSPVARVPVLPKDQFERYCEQAVVDSVDKAVGMSIIEERR